MKKLLVALSLVLLTACYDGYTDRVVLLGGDSIMRQSANHTAELIIKQDNAPLVFVNAIAGAPLASMEYNLSRLESFQRIPGLDTIVLSFGTNDYNLMQYGLANEFSDNIDTLMSNVRPDIQVYWLLPHYYPQAVQEVLDAEARWGNLTALDFIPDASELTDNVHLNNKGIARLAQVIKDVCIK